jgi:spoIIIJ-associated protein
MTDGTLFTGKTVEDAVADGLRSLGLPQEQVEIEIISRGSRGLFGIGSEPAQVRLTPRAGKGAATSSTAGAAATTSAQAPEQTQTMAPAPQPAAQAPVQTPPAPATPERAANESPAEVPSRSEGVAEYAPLGNEDQEEEADAWQLEGETAGVTVSMSRGADVGDEASDAEMAALAVELLSETVRLMGFDAEVVASWQEPDADNDERYLLLDLHGRDLGALIGRRGETLGNLQYLLRLMVNQRLRQWKNIVVDVEQYRQHRAEHLMQLAQRSAEQVAKTGRPLSLEPMPPNERRIIHLALRDNTSVYTESSGEGERRKIQILPRRSS